MLNCCMKIKQFGNTPLQVSEIGLGLAALGRPGYINLGHADDLQSDYDKESMQTNALQVLEAAYGHGVRYFDVARSYGEGEAFLAEWLRQHGQRPGLLIGSKWGYTYTAGWQVQADKHEVKEHSVEVLRRQWPESKKLLGERLGIYHIHSATLDSGVLDNTRVLDELWKLKESDIIVGLSLSGSMQQETLEKALTIKTGEDRLFQSVQATWNILEQSATAGLQQASAAGLGIIIKEALANGRLTERNQDQEFNDKKQLLQTMAKKYGVGIDALSIAFILQQPWVHTVLSGAGTKEHLLSNLQAQEVHLSREDTHIIGNIGEPAEVYWHKRATLPWN